MTLDVATIRRDFPALASGTAYCDGPGGSQVPRQVAEAIAATMTSGLSNRGAVTAAERRADGVVVSARQAVGALVGCDPGGVIFARSMTTTCQPALRSTRAQVDPAGPPPTISASHLTIVAVIYAPATTNKAPNDVCGRR